VEILEDWGRSGGAGKEHSRPAYRALRERIEAGSVQDVFSYDLSRLTRSLEEWSRLAATCRARGVRVHLAKEGTFDFATASGEMIANILASVAQAVRRWASERSAETVRVLKGRGQHIGRTVYGSEPGESAAVVRDAFLEAGSFFGAARLLNTRKVPTRTGKPWAGSAVGWIVRQQYPEVAPQAPRMGAKARADYYLYRLLRCHCGRTMTAYRPHAGYTVYRCDSGRADPTHGRPHGVSESQIIDWIKAEASRLAPPDPVVQMGESTAAQKAALAAERERVNAMYRKGRIEEAEYDAASAELDDQLAALDAQGRVFTVGPVDWSGPPALVNDVLRAMWAYVQLGPDLRPTRVERLVPDSWWRP
jgi:DNA invertase Pin-like site-specific DNA recombinase